MQICLPLSFSYLGLTLPLIKRGRAVSISEQIKRTHRRRAARRTMRECYEMCELVRTSVERRCESVQDGAPHHLDTNPKLKRNYCIPITTRYQQTVAHSFVKRETLSQKRFARDAPTKSFMT